MDCRWGNYERNIPLATFIKILLLISIHLPDGAVAYGCVGVDFMAVAE
jgi:hypothetical protein